MSSLSAALSLRESLRGADPTERVTRLRFADCAERWLERNARRFAPSTVSSHTERLGHCVAGLGDYYVDAIRPADVRRWLGLLSREYAPSVCNGCLRLMRQVLDELVEDEVLRSNPARRVRALHEPRTQGSRGRVLTYAELGRLLCAVDALCSEGVFAADIVRLLKCAAWTGCRKGELLALRWDDLREGELRIERSVWRGQVKSTKTNDPRIVALAPPLGAVLQEQRRWLLEVQHPALPTGLIWPASPRQAGAGAARRRSDEPAWFRSPSVLDRPLRHTCERAGLPRVSLHALRRTFENLLRAAGVDQLVRRSLAGWRSESAQAIYAQVSPEERLQAVEKMAHLVAEGVSGGSHGLDA